MVRFVHFFNARSHPLSDVFLNADHEELIEMHIFFKKCHPAHICVRKITWEVKNQNVKIISNEVQEMQNDERIPNLASKFKSDNI